jgi:hypothetical protein
MELSIWFPNKYPFWKDLSKQGLYHPHTYRSILPEKCAIEKTYRRSIAKVSEGQLQRSLDSGI